MNRADNITPGFHSEEHRRAFTAAVRSFWAHGGPPRCQATKKGGGPCRRWALRGHDFCQHHVASAVQRERRKQLLARPKTRAQTERAARKEAARVQRLMWRRDRWAPGSTIALGPRETQFEIDMRGLGLDLWALSPASADAARWAWHGVQAGRVSRDQMRDRVRAHALRDGRSPA